MSKKKNQKLVTPEILRQAIIGSFTKLNPRYMMKNPVMFVVEIGFLISLLLSFVPGLFGDTSANARIYNIIVAVILLITVLFANFAESVAEGRGKAQAASLRKTRRIRWRICCRKTARPRTLCPANSKKAMSSWFPRERSSRATARLSRALRRSMNPPSQVSPLRLSASRAATSAR